MESTDAALVQKETEEEIEATTSFTLKTLRNKMALKEKHKKRRQSKFVEQRENLNENVEIQVTHFMTITVSFFHGRW